MKALRTNNYLYVEYKTGEHELYDLRKDPYELDELRQCSAEECRMAEHS